MQQGFFAVTTTCPKCNGEGQTIKNPCGSCGGSGVRSDYKTVEVVIPAGNAAALLYTVPLLLP